MKKRLTAAELAARLASDAEYVKRQAEQDEQRLRRESDLRQAEKPLLEDLRAAGFAVESVWELANTPNSYAAAVPILLEHLPRAYSAAVREGIARALAVKEAGVGWGTLANLFGRETDARTKDGIATAIAAAAGEDLIGDVIALARDVRHGPSRLLLLSTLERSRDPRARAALVDLVADTDLSAAIRAILRRNKTSEPGTYASRRERARRKKKA